VIRRAFVAVGTFFRYITTARDNRTPSLIRIFGLCTALQFLWLAGYSVMFAGQLFDPLSYGGGVSSMILALGVALRVSLPANAGNDLPVAPE